jgi:NAD(P)-dependent dehydrogenase (short-subunit alcohol dehydrogenase family)
MSVLDRFNLDGRRACVTGGSRGLGLAIARGFAEAGADLVLIGRDPDALEAARTSLADTGRRVEVLLADLSVPAAAEAAAQTAIEQFDPIDILVNNVGGRRIDPAVEEQTLSEWQNILDLNLTSAFLWSKIVGGSMLSRGWGRIINIASQQAVRAFGNSGGYGASKGGLASLTRSQSEAWAPRGVCCNAISPGFVITPLTREAASDPGRSAALAARTMIGRNGEAGDFEGIAVFLASRASEYVTGQLIFVDGGFSAT